MPSGSAMKCRSLPNFIAARLLAASASSAETTTWPQRHFGKRRSNANSCRSRYTKPSVAATGGRTPATTRINTSVLRRPSVRRMQLCLLPVSPQSPLARSNARPSQSECGKRLNRVRRKREKRLNRRKIDRGAASATFFTECCRRRLRSGVSPSLKCGGAISSREPNRIQKTDQIIQLALERLFLTFEARPTRSNGPQARTHPNAHGARSKTTLARSMGRRRLTLLRSNHAQF